MHSASAQLHLLFRFKGLKSLVVLHPDTPPYFRELIWHGELYKSHLGYVCQDWKIYTLSWSKVYY